MTNSHLSILRQVASLYLQCVEEYRTARNITQYWWDLKLKHGSSVQDHHTYNIIYTEEILADFNLAIGRKTANPPNLNLCQISGYTVIGIIYHIILLLPADIVQY